MYKVLLVDDEFWALEGIESTFPFFDYGFEVIDKTTSSTKAWELIHEKKFDVVLTDICMPVISGLELATKAKSENLDCIFVIISGHSDFEYAQKAIQTSVFDYLLKPIKEDEAAELLIKLKSYLDSENNDSTFYIQPLTQIHNKEFKNMLLYISKNYSNRLQLSELSNEFFINYNYCSALFKKHFNISFPEYLTVIRMEKAAQMFQDKTISINDVANAVGYSDYFYFNKAFKKYYGVTPMQYKLQDNKNI